MNKQFTIQKGDRIIINRKKVDYDILTNLVKTVAFPKNVNAIAAFYRKRVLFGFSKILMVIVFTDGLENKELITHMLEKSFLAEKNKPFEVAIIDIRLSETYTFVELLSNLNVPILDLDNVH